MDPLLIDALERYLAGAGSKRELELQVASYDIWNAWQDDDSKVVALRSAIGALELILCEVGEGMREEDELRETASQIIALHRGAPQPRRVVG